MSSFPRAAALSVVLLSLVLPGRGLAQTAPQGCGYGTGGRTQPRCAAST